jgi:hypothetical protein
MPHTFHEVTQSAATGCLLLIAYRQHILQLDLDQMEQSAAPAVKSSRPYLASRLHRISNSLHIQIYMLNTPQNYVYYTGIMLKIVDLRFSRQWL